VWNLFTNGEQIMRAADCKRLAEKPEGVFRQALDTRKGILFFSAKAAADGYKAVDSKRTLSAVPILLIRVLFMMRDTHLFR
jgi:hypothetical protein